MGVQFHKKIKKLINGIQGKPMTNKQINEWTNKQTDPSSYDSFAKVRVQEWI